MTTKYWILKQTERDWLSMPEESRWDIQQRATLASSDKFSMRARSFAPWRPFRKIHQNQPPPPPHRNIDDRLIRALEVLHEINGNCSFSENSIEKLKRKAKNHHISQVWIIHDFRTITLWRANVRIFILTDILEKRVQSIWYSVIKVRRNHSLLNDSNFSY